MSNLTMNLEIDLSDFVDLGALEENIIDRMADVAMSKLTGGETESFHKMAVDAINEAITKKLMVVVEGKLAQTIPAVDRFGEPTGEPPKTLNDMIAEAAEATLDETVDARGKPKPDRVHSPAITRLQWLVSRVAAEGVAREAELVAKKVNKEAKEQVQQVLATAVAAQLARMTK